ncbi:MAG: type II toxin-antitoxin system VapC family toxin [bacterium]|nr:type II toxin-antitoxin system VapC family toxin [bacterium]
MRYWDSSALVPLLVEEEETEALVDLYLSDPEVITWWGTSIECASAIARLERDEALASAEARVVFRRLAFLASGWHLVEATERVREAANRLLRTHDLRAADSLQLAAAQVASEHRPASLELVCRDQRLARAADREGFNLI